MNAINARLYGGGSVATGEPAELSLFGDEIQVESESTTLRASIQALRIRQVGFGGTTGLELSWDSREGQRAVQVLDAEALNTLKAWPALASSPQMQSLRSSGRRAAFGRTLGWTALAGFVLLPVLLILLFLWQSDRIALAAISRISIEHETKLGDHAFESMRGSLTFQDNGRAYEAVQTLGKRLTAGSKYGYRFHVVKNDAINAYALPGGIIVVHSGLIQATRRPEELAGVLAHEIQHVEQRHSLQAMVKNLGLRGLWALLTGDLGGTVLGQAALQLTSLKFSREAETSADARGFDTLVEKGINPDGMADFFATLAKTNNADPPPLLSTHPASADRQEKLRKRAAEVKDRRFEPLQLGPWPPELS